ncbi:actin-like ATPase domain-containing protein [Terfezia boudieri ATCC MYA-4762]|uniref:Actin-like ATPase domain-containing protein n=1 Tax=Terfezia boudieri ATCC MYA-4762 TaxID=1051890 RepID=A0A3N4LQW7_9PEZI|nr:actin-like ATPase domain-containing protein [Terfezia boudieri ATCC MYA-4762]
MPSQKIILGIDFGTTYSGVAWASTTSPNEISPIRQWPNAGKADVDKVPSEMVYLPDGTFKWGFQTSPESIRKEGKLLQYMKLLLDPSQEAGNVLADPLGLEHVRCLLPQNKKPVDVVADYLRAVKTHALDVLSKNFGTEFWKVIEVEYHLTIPAVWSESAKALTLKAANTAGIGASNDLILIAEPEAAALYCLTDSYPGLLKVGDTFTVADCGGGTVDLVSYKVLAREPKFEVKEVAVGGGLCGSVFLNRRFEAFIRRRLGTLHLSVDMMIKKGKPYYKMMKEFDERLKRTFQDTEDQEVMDCEVPGLPDDPRTRVEDGFVEIDRAEMRAIFDPVINEILRLITEQVNTVNMGYHNSVSSVLLVGGFGSSPYLYKRVQEYSQTLAGVSKDFKVLQPVNAWSAVARGAVICGLQNIQIQSRQARRNYGITISETFDPKVHLIADKTWCPLMEGWETRNSVRWFVKKVLILNCLSQKDKSSQIYIG